MHSILPDRLLPVQETTSSCEGFETKNPEQREYLRQQNVDDALRAEATSYGSMAAFQECSLFKQDSFHAISNLAELFWRQILGGANHNLRLKPSQMGRSKHPSIKKQHHQMSSSLGRVGDYSATCEATSVHSKQVVRQCRRLQCVIRMLTKFQDDHMPDVQYQTIRTRNAKFRPKAGKILFASRYMSKLLCP